MRQHVTSDDNTKGITVLLIGTATDPTLNISIGEANSYIPVPQIHMGTKTSVQSKRSLPAHFFQHPLTDHADTLYAEVQPQISDFTWLHIRPIVLKRFNRNVAPLPLRFRVECFGGVGYSNAFFLRANLPRGVRQAAIFTVLLKYLITERVDRENNAGT